MKFAFVFPGQGSQAVGMLNAFADLAVVRETLQEASDALNQDLGKLIAEGPAEELNLTTNTQPVMLTAAYACYRAWQQAGGPAPAIVAGHSLGEYTALVAAGALAFKDAVPLVRFRAQAMQTAVPVGQGGMAAILGLDDDTVRAVCAEAAEAGVVEAVNFNAPAQVVIAGNKAAVEKACEIAKAKGAKRALPLPVSAPFHCPLMQPAADAMREALDRVALDDPAVPLFANVTAKSTSDGGTIRDQLVEQVTGMVRWRESVANMGGAGVEEFVELGGKVLGPMVKRIAPDAQVASVVTMADIEALAARI